MKKGLCMMLAATLLCVSIAGCSAPKQGKSITPSAPSGQSKPASPSLASLQSSVPASSSAPSSSAASSQATEPSSYFTSSSSASSQVIDPYDWSLANGYDPKATPAVREYYDARPQFKKYYFDYLVPLGLMNNVTWSSGSNMFLEYIVLWGWQNLTDEQRENVDQNKKDVNGVKRDIIPASLIDPMIEKKFAIDADDLHREPNYIPEYDGYIATGAGSGLGPGICSIITDAQQQSDELILTIWRIVEVHYPEYDPALYRHDENYTYQLHIRLLENGEFQYLYAQTIE